MSRITRILAMTAATTAGVVALANPASAGNDFLVWQRGMSSTPTVTAGDVDHDGDVDGRDFLTWQRGMGPTAGDIDHDGDVDGRDFLIWQRG